MKSKITFICSFIATILSFSPMALGGPTAVKGNLVVGKLPCDKDQGKNKLVADVYGQQPGNGNPNSKKAF